MKAKRLITLFLAVQMLLFNACSNAEEQTETMQDTPSASPTETTEPEESTPEAEETEDEITSRSKIPDELPDKKFDGKSFRVLVTESKAYQHISDELTGEMTNDAVHNRNVTIEDRFDCSIETVIDATPYSTIDKYVKSGTNACEIVDHYQYKAGEPISKGDYLDWNTIPYISQEKPWWNKDSNEGSTINGKLFCIVGDLSLTSMQFTYAMFFDMDLMAKYDYPSETMYNIVREGKWTIDKLNELASTVYVDNNGDSVENEGDTFGYAYWNYHGTDVWVTAIGEHPTVFENGELKVTLGTEKVFSALEKVINLVYNTTGAKKFTDENLGRSEFIAGRIGIMPLMFDDCYSALRDMEYAYGVLPYPKYDETQTNYYTNSMDQFSVFGIPKTLPEEDYEFVGILMEALNAESYKTVFPVYYDTALKDRYSTDRETAEMIDLIMDGRVYEFSFQFGESLASLPYMFRNQLYENSTDLASTLKKTEKALNKRLTKLYEYYDDTVE